MPHTLPPLPYAYDALEPYIDAQTMQLHHSKHHQTYVDKLNAALEKYPDLQSKPLEALLSDLNTIPDDIKTAVRNHGGGHWNHSFFWPLLKKGVALDGEVKTKIDNSFGSFDKFVEQFSAAAAGVFGSGWAWVVANGDKLEIIATPNQDCPITQKKSPILAIDVWEHAYYLKYQNRRPEYISAFLNVIDWARVNELLASAK